jgi:hypothetical protein
VLDRVLCFVHIGLSSAPPPNKKGVTSAAVIVDKYGYGTGHHPTSLGSLAQRLILIYVIN